MRMPLRRAAPVAIVGSATLALCLAVLASAGTSSRPLITSVTFSGGEAKPTITIRGRGLGKRPQPSPAYAPLGHPPLCPPEPTKPLKAYGLDYGTKLFVEDRTSQPMWSAGRYRPQASELDCIGVIVVKFTPSIVVLRLGAYYTEGGFHLAPNDVFRVSVNAVHASGRVRD